MKELKDRTRSRMEWATRFGVSIYGLFYILIGVVGYLSFHGKTRGFFILDSKMKRKYFDKF
jgi:amino acid permease